MKRVKLQVLKTAALLCLTVVPSVAQVGGNRSESACVSCHSAQAATQPKTPMGRAIELTGDDPTLKEHSKLTFHRGAYTYTVETHGDTSTYSVTDGTRTISLPIHWNFGYGAQTWFLERGGDYFESLVSYYPSVGGLDITTGDQSLTPSSLEEAVGRKLGKHDQKECFGCHATNAVRNEKLDLESLQPGVTCEHCHKGSAAHLVDTSQGEYGTAPPDLRKLSSEDISNFCGQCHRTWDMVIRSQWRGPIDVRFQPFRLANSRCFDGTDPRISCIACHDPHQDIVRQDSSYDGKCLVCHAAPGHPASPSSETPATCPVAKSNCVSCHMPKVKLPNGLVTFTDHQIRVVKAGEPYPN
ncbi:MAG: multiheme c-type cytochrome [Terriglobales bacterium]|nr:multiheme c-type cytochrome [Terriglobales bacterium]